MVGHPFSENRCYGLYLCRGRVVCTISRTTNALREDVPPARLVMEPSTIHLALEYSSPSRWSAQNLPMCHTPTLKCANGSTARQIRYTLVMSGLVPPSSIKALIAESTPNIVADVGTPPPPPPPPPPQWLMQVLLLVTHWMLVQPYITLDAGTPLVASTPVEAVYPTG